MRRTLQAALAYFAVVFAVRFLIGVARQLWAAPRFGMTGAELLEAPVIVALMWFAAAWAVKRERLPEAAKYRLSMGVLALGMIVLADWAVALSVGRQSLTAYIRSRGPVAGPIYILLLIVFVLMPYWLARLPRRRAEPSDSPYK